MNRFMEYGPTWELPATEQHSRVIIMANKDMTKMDIELGDNEARQSSWVMCVDMTPEEIKTLFQQVIDQINKLTSS